MKDWNGNAQSAYACIGASNHSEGERQQDDYYATEPKALEMLLDLEKFSPYVWECACGEGHLSEVLKSRGYKVKSSDIVDRGYGEVQDFLSLTKDDVKGEISRDIITNPPYKYARQFVEKALELSMDSAKIAMFLKLTFLESKNRRKLFDENPPKWVYVSSSRLQCAKNGDFDTYKGGTGTAIAYAWFIWEKGYKGHPMIKWFN